VALLPGASLGEAGLILAAAGLATTVGLIIVLYREHGTVKRGDATMFLIMLALYGLQLANSIKLDAAPHDVSRVNDQGLLAARRRARLQPDVHRGGDDPPSGQ
jgi:hypothetical protein